MSEKNFKANTFRNFVFQKDQPGLVQKINWKWMKIRTQEAVDYEGGMRELMMVQPRNWQWEHRRMDGPEGMWGVASVACGEQV